MRGASGDPGAAYATLEADARLTIGDAFVGGSANASTVPGAPVELDASAGVRTPIGTLSVHRIWDAGDPRAETFARLTTDGGLSVQAGPDKVQVNFRARF
ncbi:MAG: hypothetical protein EA385_13505 [Salinarimonadaceae bacterium]|nr:MAG: hypothetical protein EA385_13505 [Salinarimonadaceae bacterium]